MDINKRLTLKTLAGAIPFCFTNIMRAEELSSPEIEGKIIRLNTAELSIAEQLMYSTVRLELPDVKRTGTGFLFAFLKSGDLSTPAIITNRHVIEGSNLLQFRFTVATQDGNPSMDQFSTVNLSNFQSRVLVHPNSDLVAIAIGDVIFQSTTNGRRPFWLSLDRDLIPQPADLKKLLPLEPILTVGYPGNLWDDLHNLPLFHRGSTATAPNIDFRGKKEFLVDFATWPGASGSPVFIYNDGTIFDARTRNITFGQRISLIGVVYGVGVQEVDGDVVIEEAPTTYASTKYKSASQVPTNLGACLSSTLILELEELFPSRFNIVPPAGFTPRKAL